MERAEISLIPLLFISALYAAFIFWLADAIRLNTMRNFSGENHKLLQVSIIVSARNEANNISRLLNALSQQSYPQSLYEIIIVNDRSTDVTGKLLDDYSIHNPNLNILHIIETPIGWAPKKWALQSAIEQANGEIILQTDADCVPPKDWIASMIIPFSHPETGFVSGPAPLTNRQSFLDDVFELDSLGQDAFSAGGFSRGMSFSCTGRNMGFLKQAFIDVGGYDDIAHFISGDDDLLMHKITTHPQYSGCFVFSRHNVVDSPPPSSLDQFIHQRMRFASKGIDYFKIKTSNSLKIILPSIYIANITALFSMVCFANTSNAAWLLPLLVKSLSDGWLTYNFYHEIGIKWTLGPFICLSILHPIYVVIFGALGPFYKFNWKSNV